MPGKSEGYQVHFLRLPERIENASPLRFYRKPQAVKIAEKVATHHSVDWPIQAHRSSRFSRTNRNRVGRPIR